MLRSISLVPNRILAPLFLLVATPACGATSQAKSPIGVSPEFELSETESKDRVTHPEAPPDDVVLKAERPFSGYRLSDAQVFPAENLLTTLAAADGVCIGERHDQALDHYAELRTIIGFLERRQMRGFELGVGLEMLRTDDQIAVSTFERFKLEPDEFLERIDWENEWGFPSQYYMPQLEASRARGARLLALGVPRRVTREIAEKGIAGLDDYERGRLPSLDLGNPLHRKVFDELMAGHPGADESALDRYYEAQVVWDESMADLGAAWLSARRPGRKLLILAGTAHCHREAIPRRLESRTGLRIVGLLPVAGGRPVEKGADDSVDDLIAQGYEFQMVFEP